jgi:hypothetical protein
MGSVGNESPMTAKKPIQEGYTQLDVILTVRCFFSRLLKLQLQNTHGKNAAVGYKRQARLNVVYG